MLTTNSDIIENGKNFLDKIFFSFSVGEESYHVSGFFFFFFSLIYLNIFLWTPMHGIH